MHENSRPLSALDLDQCVGDVFERQVARWPDALAVKGRRHALTYREINRRANGVARGLGRILSRAPEPVVLLLDHDALLIVGILGTLKAGAIATPLDASHPPARLASLIEQCRPTVAIADAKHAALAGEVAPPGVRVLIIDEAASSGADEGPHVSVDPAAPAYMLFTSGTTGHPKGVVHSHRNLVRRTLNYVAVLGLVPGERVPLFASPSTGQGGSALVRTMLTGGSLFVHAPREHGIAAIPRLLRDERITMCGSSTTLFRAIVAILQPEDRFPDLRLLVLGGEAVRRTDFEAYRRHCLPTCKFVCRYSCTEASGVTLHILGYDDEIDGDCVPIGRPLEGQHVLLFGEDGEEVPAGEVGQISVRSRYLALGYWRDPERTADVFRAVPGSDERLYATGDLGRWRADGTLEHLGRVDGRVKVRGARVEVEEVEGVLRGHAAVAHAAVAVRSSVDGQDELVAFIVVRPGAEVSAHDMREFVARSLPASAVPSRFLRLDELPLTGSGKVDRASLPSTAEELSRRDTSAAPRSDLERDIAAIWRELLGPHPVGVHDRFLLVGGDSLRGTRLLARVVDRWGVDISFAEFLDAPTIAGLAKLIERRLEEELSQNARLLEDLIGEDGDLQPSPFPEPF